MNRLLVDEHERTGDTVVIRDRRAEHLRTVLGATVGSTVKAGVVGGATGHAEVLADDGTAFTLRLVLDGAVPLPMGVELVLAIPRPKVLSRALEAAASFGIARIALTNAWRVDKSYLKSPRLEPDAMAHATRLGAEQGGTTHVPPVTVFPRFMQLLDSDWVRAPSKLVAHPDAPPLERIVRDGPHVLAIGPEGGWIQREVDTFVERGYRAVSLGPAILRVESALSAALAQLALIARLREC